jgi:hypothetical protein
MISLIVGIAASISRASMASNRNGRLPRDRRRGVGRPVRRCIAELVRRLTDQFDDIGRNPMLPFPENAKCAVGVGSWIVVNAGERRQPIAAARAPREWDAPGVGASAGASVVPPLNQESALSDEMTGNSIVRPDPVVVLPRLFGWGRPIRHVWPTDVSCLAWGNPLR